jgi:hypothetical protein
MGKSNRVSRSSAQLHDHHRGRLIISNDRSDAAPEIQLWNREVGPFARDLLFMMAIFFYVVGFAHQSSKMDRFGMEVQLGDQPLSSLFSWAAEAIEDGWFGFLLIFAASAALMCAAVYLKHRLIRSAHYRAVVYGIVTLAVVGGTLGAGVYAWSTGITRANDYAPKPNATAHGHQPNPVKMFADPVKGLALLGTPNAPTPVYIISETNDMFEVMAPQLDGTEMPLALRRADIRYIEYRPNDVDKNPTVWNSGEHKVHTKTKIATPLPNQAGS